MNLPPDIEIAVFDAARLMEDPQARDAFLEWAFRDSPEDAARMKDLFHTEEEARTWFDEASESRARVAAEITRQGQVELPARVSESIESLGFPESISNRFQILRRLGEGGGGVVYLAEQAEPVRRNVAIKVLRAGMDSPAFLAAFQRERQSLALMNHPNIAGILDAGTTQTSQPYLVMELVEGRKITRFCDDQGLTIHQRLGLFLQVCSAIQHAHQKGIIHRDIKPSNILVSSEHTQPLPKVIDFGIAAATASGQSSIAVLLAAGTPAYMSPEQADPHSLDIDTRADVFSLGVLLYELLAGEVPWSPATMPFSVPTPSDFVAGMDPRKLAVLAGHRQIRPAQLVPALREDLDAIVCKAISSDRQQRYDTVNSLAMDLRRHLDDQPVVAHPPGKVYFLRKFVRRNRLAVLSGSAVMTALLLGAGIAFRAFLRERDALRETEIARANESALRQEAQARENVAKAAILLSQNQIEEADSLLRQTPLPGVRPSREAADAFRFLGERNAILGRWRQASDSFVKLMQANQLESPLATATGKDLLLAGPSLLECGDKAGYHLLRKDMLARFPVTDHPVAAEHMVKMCLLLPADSSIMRQLEPMAALLKSTFEEAKSPQGWDRNYLPWVAMAKSLFDYRNGDFQGALDWAEKCLKSLEVKPSRIASVRMISAMAHHHLGHRQEAEQEFATADKLIRYAAPKVPVENVNAANQTADSWHAWSVARLLQREAKATLGAP